MIDVHVETVGSFLRPPELLLARQRFKQNLLSCAELRAAEDRAIRDVVRLQEEVGLRVVTDGEFRRENWWIDFVANLRGAEIREGSPATSFDQSYVPKHVQTTSKLRADGPILAGDYQFLFGATHLIAKITIPSATRLHFHGGRNAVSTATYPDIEAFFSDVASVYQAEITSLEQAGCRYIQIDDPLLTYFLSPKLRADVTADGDDPDRRLADYLDWLNACIANRQPETTIGIHLCRGNARSEWISEGT
jgi:5-methyltetrahydropteroyltriglutamate--homocysteine methyltransferase